MVTRRTNTLHPLDQLRSEVDRLFTGFLGTPAAATAARLAGRAFPALNVWETGDELFVEAELPGVKSENVEISVVGSELTIKGERPEAEQEGAGFHRRERGVGPFTRVLRLPVDVNADRVQASLKDGVLLITLPKSEAAKPRKIQVNS
jgi:HSP20 family protein